MMISMFNRREAKDILLSYIDSNPIMIERYYATEFLNRVNATYPAQYPISTFQNMNLNGLYNLTKAYVDEATKTKSELKPYGWSGTTTYMTNNAEFESALKFLQFMIESGIRITYGSYGFVNEKDWYIIFKRLFVYFPYPTLFYSIQCSSEDILKRIGQDYAYEDMLHEDLPQILSMLLQYLLAENKSILDLRSVLIITQELLVAVPHSKWDKIILRDFEDIDRNNDWFKFINSGLKYIKTGKYITKIISDCLSHSKKSEAIDYLYNLEGARRRSLKVKSDLRAKIDVFADGISTDNEFVMAGNIYKLLNDNNFDVISEKIRELKTNQDINSHRLYSISYFAKNKAQDINVIKHIVINHRDLWDNGLLDNGATSPSFIALSRFDNNIRWTRQELVKIFHKLKSSFEKLSESPHFLIDNSIESPIDAIFVNMISHRSLLKEMDIFLTKYKSQLQSTEGYSTIAEKVYSELISRRKYDDIYEALCSDVHSNVVNGLNEMYRHTQAKGFGDYSVEINMLTDRILLKKTAGLLAALEYAEHYLKNYYVNELFTKDVKRKYLLMLKIYQDNRGRRFRCTKIRET